MAYTSSPGAIIRLGVDGDAAAVQKIEAVAASMNRLSDTVQSATRKLAATIGIGGGLAEVIQLSDEYTKFTSQLHLATQSQREYAIAAADVRRIAKESQAELSGTGVLYARIANGTRELGISQARVAAITEVVNLSLKVSAATTAEAASAQLQLSQAFASGTLRGEEFNAVNEAAPRLMKALADGMGVPIGALKQMASDGQITAKMMSDVLPQALGTLREEATQVQTIGGAFQVLKNNVMEFTAVNAQANGTVSVLTTGLSLLSNNLGLVVGLLTTMTAAKAGTWLASWAAGAYTTALANRELLASTLAAAEADVAATAAASALANARVAELRAAVLASEGNTALAITTNGLIPAQARAAAMAEAHTVALAAQSAALGSASVAAGVARGALAFLGGPVGAVVTVLGLAATAWSVMGSAAKEGAEKSVAAVRESTSEILAGLDKQIDKLHERNKLARLGIPTAKNDNVANDRMGEILTQLDAAGKGTGDYAGLNYEARIEIMKVLGGEYNALTVKVAALNKELDEESSNKNKKSVGEWMVKYATNAEKLKTELDAARKELGAGFTPELEARIRKQFEEKAASNQKEVSAYATLSAAVREKIAGTAQEAAGLEPLNEAQKLQVVLNEQIASGKLKISATNKAAYESELKLLAANLEMIKARKRSAELDQIQSGYAEQQGKALEAAFKEATANEELARTFGMTKSAIEQQTIARMEARVEQLRGIDMADDEIHTLELLIEARKRSAAAIGSVEQQEATKKATDKMEKDQLAMWESIDRTAHDTFVSIFDSGKSAFDRLRDTLKNGLLDLLYQMTVKKWILNISGSVSSSGMSGISGIAEGASALSSGGSLLGAAGNLYSAVSGGMTLGGGLGSGFMGSLAGGLNGAGVGSGLTSSIGLQIGNGISSVVGPEIAGALSSGLGTLAAAAPYLAAALAAYALYKHFDTGNTPHTGGASMASSAGSNTIRAESIGFADTKTSSAAEQMTAALASSVVTILDSTALAFGKTAGYTAATAFADDSSKDGAWGALVINKLGSKVLDWNDTRSGGSWAPKEFADGDAGQAQYMAALAGGVRTALDQIGLPSWATKMLDDLGGGASIDDLAKVVSQINATEQALSTLGANIKGFAGLSDATTTALIGASGGIAALSSNASAYFNAFYSEAEKSASAVGQIKDALASVGVQMPANLADYRAEVEARMALGEAGAPAVAMMLKLAGAFAQVQPQLAAVVSTARSAADVLAERNDLQKQYDQLTMTSAELRGKERDTIDSSNLALFDKITERQAVNATTEALQSMFDSLKSNREGILAYTNTLKMGSLSTLTPMQKYLEAQQQYSSSLAKAKASPADAAAQTAVQSAGTAFLTASQTIYASSAAYVADRSKVLGDMSSLAEIASAQMSEAQQQLGLAGEQVEALTTLNNTALGIQQAIVSLGGGAGGQTFNASTYAGPSDGRDVLVQEIKRLNARVNDLVRVTEARRNDAQKQTDSLSDATESSAEIIALGLAKSMAENAWRASNPATRALR